jgi:pantoate--beta-alanine ligase
MLFTGEINQVRAHRWAKPAHTWGLVPTMCFLHEGHLSLVRRARAENDRLAVSIFVNPTQFGSEEDLSAYPRNLEGDLALLAAENVDLVFTPDNQTMYPPGFQTKIIVEQVTQPLEGAARPTHFQGVATVVAKLFNIIQPTRAYFGQKDAQQTIVLRRLVVDLNFNLEIIVNPTVREQDGLAMSSRNFRLAPQQRQAAAVLYQALQYAAEVIKDGERDGERVREVMAQRITAEPLARLDYVSAADPDTLQEVGKFEPPVLLSLAVFFDKVRLIDNILYPGATHFHQSKMHSDASL